MRWWCVFVWLVVAVPASAACDWSETARHLVEPEGLDPPATPLDLYWILALDPDRADRIVGRADASMRCHTADLLHALTRTEPEARAALPGIHRVRDLGPGPGERPPTWADVRLQGLRLLRAIAADPAQARDLRLLRELDRDTDRRVTPSRIGGWLGLWEEWWVDRGHDPAYYADPDRVPDVTAWEQAWTRTPAQGGQSVRDLLLPLVDDPLRRRMLLDRLEPARHEGLVAECMHWLQQYQDGFEAAGFPAPGWDPDAERTTGVRAQALRGVCLEVLERATGRVASGADEHTLIVDWLGWWRRARFEARYYRDPDEAPSLAPWLAPLAPSANDPLTDVLRQWYLAAGFRDLLLDQLGSAHAPRVADLMAWLLLDADQAQDAGFQAGYTLRPIRPRPDGAGRFVAIPWDEVRSLVASMLERIVGAEGPLPFAGADASPDRWGEWWVSAGQQPRWYRPGEAPVPAPTFTPERARG